MSNHDFDAHKHLASNGVAHQINLLARYCPGCLHSKWLAETYR
jgi:hypothetical protein